MPLDLLLQSAKAQLHKSELQLHHRKHVFHLRAHPRLRPVLRPLHFVNTMLVAVAPMGAVLGLRRALPGSLRSVRDKPDRPTPAFPRRAIDRAAPPNRRRWPPSPPPGG